MLADGSAPTESVVTLVVERRRGRPSGTSTGSARIVTTATMGQVRSELQGQSAAWKRDHGWCCSDENHGREGAGR